MQIPQQTIVAIAVLHGILYNLAQYENITKPTSSENLINISKMVLKKSSF